MRTMATAGRFARLRNRSMDRTKDLVALEPFRFRTARLRTSPGGPDLHAPGFTCIRRTRRGGGAALPAARAALRSARQAAAAVLIMIESMYDEDEERISWPRGFTLALTPVRKGVVG